MAALPEVAAAPANGVKPEGPAAGPAGPAGQWIVIGPRTRAHMGPVLERALGVVWQALLEVSGAPDGAPYVLVVDAAHLEPAPPERAT